MLPSEVKGARCPASMKMIARGQKDVRARLDPADPARQIPWSGCLENEYLPSVCCALIGPPPLVSKDCILFDDVPDPALFYFVHSYYLDTDTETTVGTCTYGIPMTAAVQRGNVFGTQFHPEKSQDVGLRMIGNFLTWAP